MGAKVKEGLKIIELRGENFKKIKAIVIRPDDNLVLLTGKNAQGKSSAIDLIIAMLGKDRKWIPQPIRKGQTHADGKLDLGEFIVVCKWTEKGKYLKVTSQDGLVYPSPQAMLDGFVGKLGFDIGKFFNMEEKEQTEVLMDLAKLDFTDVDIKIERLVEERRVQGQTVKLLNGQRQVFTPELAKQIPKGLVSINELNVELGEAQDFNRLWHEKGEHIKSSEAIIEGIGDNIVELEQKIENSKKEQDRHRELIKRAEKYIEENTPIQTDRIRNKIDSAEEVNELFRANERNKLAEEKYNQENAVYENLTTTITGLRESKDCALRDAEFPLPELKATTTGLFYEDIPIKQLSSSERMKVAMSIAMALNEKFKVILVKEASLLDKDNLKVIREMAKDGGYQVWLEMVSDTGEMGFYFVDGEITAVNGKITDKELIDGGKVDAEFVEGGSER